MKDWETELSPFSCPIKKSSLKTPKLALKKLMSWKTFNFLLSKPKLVLPSRVILLFSFPTPFPLPSRFYFCARASEQVFFIKIKMVKWVYGNPEMAWASHYLVQGGGIQCGQGRTRSKAILGINGLQKQCVLKKFTTRKNV